MFFCSNPRSLHCKAVGKPLHTESNPKKKASPLYKMRFPAFVPEGALTQQEVKAMLPPGASCWRSNLGSGQWWVHLPPHPRISKSWTIQGHYEAAQFVLKGVWRQWLDDNGLTTADCPVAGLFT